MSPSFTQGTVQSEEKMDLTTFAGRIMFHITVRIAALWQMSFSSSCYGQPTRLMLRLCLIQHGTHFLSDLMPGEAGAWTAEACFLQKQGTEVEILEEQV